MKNLLTYVSPTRDFNDEHKMLAKIQIDNSLNLGWRADDILLVTNFSYGYGGVTSLAVSDDSYCAFHWPATKIYVIEHLFQAGLIAEDLYWYHDFDCFQLAPFTEPVIGLADMGLTNYGRMPRLCSASMFFRKTAGDIFERLKEEIDKSKMNEEWGLMKLINGDASLKQRVELLNITYAFHRFNFHHCYARVTKPIKAAHFHLTPDKFDFYVKGNNILHLPLIPERLVEVFRAHGFAY